jgi:hypothetical protein
MPNLMPSPEHEKRLLRMVTAASHGGESKEELIDQLAHLLAPQMETFDKKAKGNLAQLLFLFGRSFMKRMGKIQSKFDNYLDREMVAAGKPGEFDARSLGCWLEIARHAGVAAVPAIPILEMHEVLIELAINPDAAEQPATKPGVMWRMMDAFAGGQLERNFGRLSRIPLEEKRKMLRYAMHLLYEAGDKIPAGHMVRHDQMGPNTLKAWACVGWEPWNGDDGVEFPREDGSKLVLGPGWVSTGNRRAVDVLDSRTTMAIGQAMTDFHTFWARPWMKPARRYQGLDITRPESWPEEQRRGTWPAEWRVFVRGGKAVACASYYPWAEISGDETDQKMAKLAMEKAQAMADACQRLGIQPGEPKLDEAREILSEAREMLPPGTCNATLDFIETEEGLLFLEGAMAAGPGGYGAHPCAFAGHRWAEGIKFQLDPGINIAAPKTWPEDCLRGFKK